MSKNIVICCDGTGNEYCKKKTNVAKLFDIVENRGDRQVAYYDPGVGTLGSMYAIGWFTKKLSWLYGLAFAFGLPQNIEDAYSFLMDHYEEGDRIYLFGFSRGAYTVRALGGMIMKCGLLHKEHKNLIPYATKLYRNRKKKRNSETVVGFRNAFSHKSCIPYFIGVWDTVKSVGVVDRIQFGDTRLAGEIRYGYHALSINEKRRKYRPVLWESSNVPTQTIEQVWFPGVHCDVGGSYDRDGLSDMALKWMAKKARAQGLIVDTELLDKIIPNCGQKPNKSFKWFWLILGFHIRKIEAGNLVHSSAMKRMDKVKGYRPRNLLKVRDQVVIVDDEIGC